MKSLKQLIKTKKKKKKKKKKKLSKKKKKKKKNKIKCSSNKAKDNFNPLFSYLINIIIN